LMKSIRSRSAQWGSLLALAFALIGAPSAPVGDGNPTPQVTWKPLFNGRNLDAWEIVNTAKWEVKDGAIITHRSTGDRNGVGWLVTKQDYDDFFLRLKFKPGSEVFNSGILIRDPGHARVGRPAFNGFEIKMAQGENGQEINGCIYALARAYLKRLPGNEWTSFEVQCVGDHITSYINGEKMAETYCRRSYRGAVGLHLHGGPDEVNYEYKDIEIAELPRAPRPFQTMEEKMEEEPGEYAPLWSPGSAEQGLNLRKDDSSAWSLRDGVLTVTGAAADGWAITKKEYSNFILDFSFKASAGGEGGVCVRLPQAASPSGSEAYEFQIAGSDDQNPTGSILGLAPAFTDDYCEKPIARVGNWNQGRIYISGDHIVSYLNLMKVAEIHAGRSGRGAIGFHAIKGVTLAFRNITIKEIR
jgi:hypothetical protein